MKKYKHLWDKICTLDNFVEGLEQAIKGKSYYTEVNIIKRYGKHKFAAKLLDEVRNKTYKVSEYEIFHRFTGGKDREIYKLPMRDRIVQHTLMNVLEPIFRETFIVETYSAIKFRGTHSAAKRIKRMLRREPDIKYYLNLDIRKCYPSLDQNILKDKLRRKFEDNDLLWLLFTIIDSCEKGVPIGNYTSQYLNNFYFNDFDHWIKEKKRVAYYSRYCDNILIFGKTKEELRELFSEIKVKIAELNVTLKDDYQIYDIDVKGVDSVGYIMHRTHTRVRRHTKLSFIRKVRNMDMNNLSSKDVNVLGSYWGIFVHADCRNLWYKYTGVKTFKDLNVKVHERDFVKNIIGIPIVIHTCCVFQKRGTECVKFDCSYKLNTKDGVKEFNDIVIVSSGELLVEASKKISRDSFPFTTTIIVNEKGFYQFT